MVNQNEGKKYDPTMVYSRKALRNIIRAQAKKADGVGQNKRVGQIFHEVREKMLEKGEN